MGPLHLEHTLDCPISGPLVKELTPCGNLPSVVCTGEGCTALPLIPQQRAICLFLYCMSNIHLLARVYLCHPGVVGLPTNKRDLYHPPPLDRDQVIPFSQKWGIPMKKVPQPWGTAISPILVAMHLEVEGVRPAPQHCETIIQYILWNGGDKVLMWLLLMARARPENIPRRTLFWYLQRYNLQLTDIQGLGVLHPDHRGNWVWTLKEVRDALRGADTLVVEWYRLAYLVPRQ